MNSEIILNFLQKHANNKLLSVLGNPSEMPWTAHECGDGNINYIFVIKGNAGSAVVKHAPPFIRLVGPVWPLKQHRMSYEILYTQYLLKYSKMNATQIYFSDDQQMFLFAMEDLNAHGMKVFRTEIANGIGIEEYPNIGQHIGNMVAHMLFKTRCISIINALFAIFNVLFHQ